MRKLVLLTVPPLVPWCAVYVAERAMLRRVVIEIAEDADLPEELCGLEAVAAGTRGPHCSALCPRRPAAAHPDWVSSPARGKRPRRVGRASPFAQSTAHGADLAQLAKGSYHREGPATSRTSSPKGITPLDDSLLHRTGVQDRTELVAPHTAWLLKWQPARRSDRGVRLLTDGRIGLS